MRESWISSVGAKRRTLSLKDEIMAWADWLASIARCGKMTGIDWQKRDQLSVIMGFCSSSVSRVGGSAQTWQRRMRVVVSSCMCSRAVMSSIKSMTNGRRDGFHGVGAGNGNVFGSAARWASSGFGNK